MYIYGSVECTNFDDNRFDICDMAGLFIENSRGGTFINNTFNRCMLGTDPALGGSQDNPAADNTTRRAPTSTAIVRIKSSHNLNFSNNTLRLCGQWAPEWQRPVRRRSGVSGSAALTTNNRINNSTYLNYSGSAYVKSIVVDAPATAPIET